MTDHPDDGAPFNPVPLPDQGPKDLPVYGPMKLNIETEEKKHRLAIERLIFALEALTHVVTDLSAEFHHVYDESGKLIKEDPNVASLYDAFVQTRRAAEIMTDEVKNIVTIDK